LTFLNRHGISIRFLQSAGKRLSSEIGLIIQDEGTLSQALDVLDRTALIRIEKGNITIHVQVQKVVKGQISDVDLETWHRDVIALCDAGFPAEVCIEIPFSKDVREQCRCVLDQVIVPLSSIGAVRSRKASHLFMRLSYFLEEDSRFSDSEKFAEMGFEMLMSLLGQQHRETLAARRCLARTRFGRRRIGTTVVDLLALRKIMSLEFGDDDPDTLKTLEAIVSAYCLTSNLDAALEITETLLTTKRRIHGMENPSTVEAMHHVTGIYQRLGNLEEAKALEEKVLETLQTSIREAD
jgi:Tetratricopeptide repeat